VRLRAPGAAHRYQGENAVRAAVIVGLACLACALTRVGPLWHVVDGTLRAHHDPLATRDVAPMQQYIAPFALVTARETIPADATYSVVVGQTPPTSELLQQAIPLLFRYWLLPRRYTSHPHQAEWVIAYHAPSVGLGLPVAREIGLGPDANLDRIAPG